jgi:L-amino acid N-acyltransferase YncA
MRIEPAADRHVPGIAAIYAHAADTSPATFDLEGRSEEWWREEIARADSHLGHMTLVALGPDDEVLGYAKSGRHMERPAYDTTCQISAYVAESARGKGVAGALYDELLARLEASTLRLAVAGIAEPNEASTRLHVSRGFKRVGTFTGVGTKFGRSWDVTWYERPLGAGAAGSGDAP